jgi:hypothetical protein
MDNCCKNAMTYSVDGSEQFCLCEIIKVNYWEGLEHGCEMDDATLLDIIKLKVGETYNPEPFHGASVKRIS